MGQKKTRKVLAREQAASVAVEAEKTRHRMMKDMQDEIRMEEQNEKQQAIVEAEEGELREKQLRQTRIVLNDHEAAYQENALISEAEENWNRYMTCDGLPDPSMLSDMNTFMFLWTMEDEEAGMNTIPEKCDVVIYLLTKLDEIVRFSSAISSEYVEEYDEVARRFRQKLQWWIDIACYRLLRQMDTAMTKEDTKTTRYVHVSSHVTCCLWALIPLPVGTKRFAEKDKNPIEVTFEELELTVKMPIDLDCYRMAIRGLRLTYDHYSIEATSGRIPNLPDEYQWNYLDLLEFYEMERQEKIRLREEQVEGRRLRLEEKRMMLERMARPPATASERRAKHSKKKRRPGSAAKGKKSEPESGSESASMPASVPGTTSSAPDTEQLPYLPTPDEIIRRREEEMRKEIRKFLFVRCERTEVNLRKYKILGGVFRVDLIYQPPQPKDIGDDSFLTTLELPKEPRFVPFSRPYVPPPPAPDSERTPEVIEAEMKALETAMEALALVTLKLPSTILWFEPPLVAHWIPEKNMWSTRDIHDIKYNEEKQTIAFRTGRLGVHGLAAYKYINLPFQSWELKPEVGRNAQGGVVLSVTAATVQAEFVEDRVCLNSLAGGTSTALKGIIGEYMKLHFLVEKMREAGCDLFPEPDAASYLKGLALKHPVAEKHLRNCMALLSTSYIFAWSRWNASRDFRQIVIQFKELHGCIAKERTNLTLLVTPMRTMLVRCTEVSSEFSDLSLEEENVKFYADLYHLALCTAGIKSRLLMRNISFKLVTTVAQLLERTSVIGMSS